MPDWPGQQRRGAPHVPVIDKSGRKHGTFERAGVTQDAGQDIYTCPGGQQPMPTPRERKPDEDGLLRDRACKTDCDASALNARCGPKEPSRHVTRSIDAPSRDVARAIARMTQYAISCGPRRKVERPVAHLRRIPGRTRLR